MSKIPTIDLTLVKASLTGANLKKLLSKKNLTMWRIHKDCNISYQTLINWKNGLSPSDELAERVGKHLGLISPCEVELLELKKEQAELKKKIDRLI